MDLPTFIISVIMASVITTLWYVNSIGSMYNI